jgi:hypothetical protein
LKDGNADKRAKAVRSLGLLPGNADAERAAINALQDIPFAGMGYEAFKTVKKNDSSPVRAAAAKQLAQDPDPGTAKALVKATTDKNWRVRAAALDGVKDDVRFSAAACVAHLSGTPTEKTIAEPAKP